MNLLIQSLVAVISFAFSASAFATTATTVDFEAIPGAITFGSDNQIPDGYENLHWSSDFYVLHNSFLPNTGYDYGAIGDWVAYSGFANPVSFWSDFANNFNFSGAYIASAWTAAESITVEGWDNGVLKYTTTLTATNNQDDLPQLFAFNFKGIDKVTFSGYTSHIVFDNLILQNVVPLSTVPEPETYAILLAGLAFVGSVARRKTA